MYYGSMKKKKFINLSMYWHKRHKYNPMRFILGSHYLSSKVPHHTFDMKDVTITASSGDDVKDYIAKLLAVYHLNKNL